MCLKIKIVSEKQLIISFSHHKYLLDYVEKNLFQILSPNSDQIVSLASYAHPMIKYLLSSYYVLDTSVTWLPEDIVPLWPFQRPQDADFGEAPSFITHLEEPEAQSPGPHLHDWALPDWFLPTCPRRDWRPSSEPSLALWRGPCSSQDPTRNLIKGIDYMGNEIAETPGGDVPVSQILAAAKGTHYRLKAG